MNSKKTIGLIMRAASALIFLILAFMAVLAPFSSSKVNITGDEVPYNSRASLSAVSSYKTTKQFMEISAQKTEAESLPKEKLAKIGFLAITSFDMKNFEDDGGLKMLNVGDDSIIGELTSPGAGLHETGIMAIFSIVFAVAAILVGFSGSRASYGIGIATSAVFAVKIVRTAVSLAAYTTLSLSDTEISYFKDYDITFYDFSATPAYYFALILLVFGVIASALAISFSRTPVKAEPAPAPFRAASVPVKPSASPASEHCITCVRGEQKGGKFSISAGEEIVLGRDSETANIVVVAPKISRKHCIIRYDSFSNSYYVTDCSTNGTFNADNGQRLTFGAETNVPCGTMISLGNSDNQFRLD